MVAVISEPSDAVADSFSRDCAPDFPAGDLSRLSFPERPDIYVNLPAAPKIGVVISDLHIFAKRAAPAKPLLHLYKQLSQCDYCVLNGDIFDFGWTKLGSIDQSIHAAERYLTTLCMRYPRCEFHFVVGNHDSVTPFLKTLEKLKGKLPNFKWNASHVRIGSNLFLHGDVTNWKHPTAEKLKEFRAFYDQKIHRGKFMNFLASLSSRLGLHKLETHLETKEALCKKILYYFDKESPESLKNIRNIYFGHTHVPFSDFKYRGFLFHNTGSAEISCESQTHLFVCKDSAD